MPMASVYQTLLLSFLLATISPSHSATCSSQSFPNNRLYSLCADLSTLNSFLHWTYDSPRSTLSLAFTAAPPSPNGWVSWAINPTAAGMVGSQALIAFRDNDGRMTVKTYNISSYGPLTESRVWYQVSNSSAEFSGGVMRLFATLVLPPGATTMLNHVWQVGPSVTGGVPDKHAFQPANLISKGRLDLLRGDSIDVAATGGDSRTHKRNIHGILNAVSWGIMFPAGVIIARYMRTFPSADPTWFYLHVFCQVFAYAIGVAGWATGLKLGSQSQGVVYSLHRNIGIALFALATVQIFALFLRPKKDHKYRFYWNIYHHSFGYGIVILGIINVFRGFNILNPEQKWRHGYIIVLAVLGGLSILLEAITWIVILRRRKSGSGTKPYDGVDNGSGRREPLHP